MRRFVVGGLILLLGLCQAAFATDYELTVDASSQSVLKEKTITIYEQFDLIKPGDRIVSLSFGQLPVPSMSCKVYPGAGSSSTVLTQRGDLANFGGEIRLGSGNPGPKAFAGALLVHVVPVPTDTRKSVIIRKVGGFFETYPIVWIIIGAGILVGIGIAYYRLNVQPAGAAPVYGKRAYEENIRDVKARLERIMEAQEALVAKPPVLRAFRKQIERFDKRLDHLESTTSSNQQTASSTAANLNALHKELDNLAAHERQARHALDQLAEAMGTKSEDHTHAISALREETRKETARLESLAAGLATQLSEQSQRNESQSRSLGAEIARLQQMLAEADQHIADLQVAMSQADQGQESRASEVARQVASLTRRVESIVPEATGALSPHFDEVKSGLNAVHNQTAEARKLLSEQVNNVNLQLSNLTPVADGVSEVAGKLEQIQASLGSVADNVSSGNTRAAEFQKGVGEALSGTLRESLGQLQSDLAKLQSEAAGSQAAAEKTGDQLSALAKDIEALRGGALTKSHLEPLQDLPKLVARLGVTFEETTKKLVDAGMSRKDIEAVLNAHEKLGALPGELSLTLQKTMEQKLATLVAQSLTVKKGKDSDISDQSASILSEVANQLLVEIEHQKSLETAFGELRAKLESVPESIVRLEERLATANASAKDGHSPGLSALLDDVKAKLDAIPEKLELLARSAEAQPAQNPSVEVVAFLEEARNAAKGVPDKLDQLDLRFQDVSAKWEHANQRLEHAISQIHALPAQQSVEKPVEPTPALKPEKPEKSKETVFELVETTRHPVEVQPDVPAESLAPPKGASTHVLSVDFDESFGAEQVEPNVAGPAAKVEAKPAVEPPLAAETLVEAVKAEVAKEELTQEILLPKAEAVEIRIEKPKSGTQLWDLAGGPAGDWQVVSGQDLALHPDRANAVKPMTPTETPGIEYEIGAMLYAEKRVIYAHGDSIRAFWPGGSEKSLMLSHAVPNETWRLLKLKNTLFCAMESGVESVDLGTWSRGASFQGVYRQQCVTNTAWAGVKEVKSGLGIEFRDPAGEIVGKVHEFPADFGECIAIVSDGKNVFVANGAGKTLQATPQKLAVFTEGAGNSLLHLTLTKFGPVGVFSSEKGLELARFDANGAIAKSGGCGTKEISGNLAVLGQRIYFYDAAEEGLFACDLESMLISGPTTLANVQRLRRMIALDAGKTQSLLVAGCDSGGKLGSVFLLDTVSGEQLTLCSTNQPHVEAIFADCNPVVATSSSYQNIIRVFQPYVAESSAAA
jgi:predicted  nucleic acid-binding Zn-ribbon protein